jgi:short-subunit dehydrogenase
VDVRDKVVIITGASGGIGLATARLFAREGAKLALVARSTDILKQLVEELGPDATMAITADVSQRDQIYAMIEQVYARFGRIDVLINNAAQGMGGPVININTDHYHQIMELNVFGPLYAMQAVVPKMREHGGGLIINISSMVSKYYIPGVAAYSSTKYTLNALSLIARTELARENIRVALVYPNVTDTNFFANVLTDGAPPPSHNPQPGNPKGDTPETVAEKILEAAHTEQAELLMEQRT